MSPTIPPESSQKTLREVRLAARRRKICVNTAIALLALAALGSIKPIYHRLKHARASQFALEGDRYYADQHWVEATAKYRAALQLDPANTLALRGAARLGTRAGQVEAIEFWKQIAGLPEMTTADDRLYASLALQAGKMEIAEHEISRLLQRQPDASSLSLAAQYFDRQENLPKALEFARSAVKAAPGEAGHRFQLAQLLARSPNAEGRAEAREILWSLADNDSAYHQPALEALAAAPDLSKDEQQRVAQALRLLPHLQARDDLLAAGLTINSDPKGADAVYDAAVEKWRAGSVEDRVQLFRWLNSAGQFARVLALLPASVPATTDQLLLVQLDALAALRQWDEVERLLSEKGLPLDAMVAECFRARAAQERDLPLDADLHWNRAISNARDNASKLRFLANFAEQSHAPQALKIYAQLERFPQETARALRASQRILSRNGDPNGLLVATEKLAALEPANLDAKNEVAYLRLLLERDVKGASQTAQELAASQPDRLAFRVTRGLGFLRLRRSEEALKSFDAPAAIDWQKTPARWRAVYAATLAANGQAERAREIINGVSLAQLYPQEKALIAPLLSQTD